VITGLHVTRLDLLAGLIGYALYAANQTGRWNVLEDPNSKDIRIAHPVWPASIKHDADRALNQIAWLAANMASAGDWGKTSVDVLTSWTMPIEGSEEIPELQHQVDVIEPVAAAVELLPGVSNQRRICVVLDVGAGTTDIGVFQQLSPDSTSKLPNKLLPAGPTSSVFKAGDAIDKSLLQLLKNLYPSVYSNHKVEIKTDIRFLKENLLKNGRIQIHGVDLSLEQLEKTDDIRGIAAEVRKGFEQCLRDASNTIETWMGASPGLTNKILVVMAGGGAEINFLRRIIASSFTLKGRTYEFEVMTPKSPISLNMHGAGYTRLAVGLGGVRELYDSVVHEHSKLLRIGSLGKPKQVI
jgi:molecular chaperone HscA